MPFNSCNLQYVNDTQTKFKGIQIYLFLYSPYIYF